MSIRMAKEWRLETGAEALEKGEFDRLKSAFLALPVIHEPNTIEWVTYLSLKRTSTEAEFASRLFDFVDRTSRSFVRSKLITSVTLPDVTFLQIAADGTCRLCGASYPDEPLFSTEGNTDGICVHCALFTLAIIPVNEPGYEHLRGRRAESIRRVCEPHAGSCVMCSEFLEQSLKD